MLQPDLKLTGLTRADSRVAHLTWDAVEARIKAGAVAILPIGAASKQHGLHLPLNTDQVQADYLAEHLANHIDALIWPTVTYGHYPAFTDYPGSISFSAQTFAAMIAETAGGIVATGARGLIVIDTGISTIAPVREALARFPESLHLPVHRGAKYHATAARIAEQTHGSHADEIETSLMLALAPRLVTMARAQPSSPDRDGKAQGPLTRNDSSSANYSPSGSFGDPTKASRAKGEVLLAAMLDDVVGETRAFFAALKTGEGARP